MKSGFGKKFLSLCVFIILTTGFAASATIIDVADAEGEDVDDFDITVENNETSVERDSIDVFERDLEVGTYSVKITKDGYQNLNREIIVQEGADTSYTYSISQITDDQENSSSDINIGRVQSPESVCRSETFSVDFDIENNGNSSKVVSTSGFAFGNVLAGKSFTINSGQTKTYRFFFTSPQSIGEKQFRVSASALDSDSETRTVEVEECVASGTAAAVESIDVNLYPVQDREKATVGEVVRVKGFADGVRGQAELNMSINGEDSRTIQAGRDGFFETFIRFDTAGSKTVTVSAPSESDSATLEVVPNPSLGGLQAPDKVFSGENFEICGQIDSTVVPEVALTENGNVLETREANGNVCFDIQAPEPGEYDYQMRVLTYGEDDNSSKEIEVLEQGSEAESFPGQVSSVETEDSLVKVQLYNTNDYVRNYTVKLDNLPAEWTSQNEKNATLEKGERKTVYFYLSPAQRGEYDAALKVESQGEQIYEDSLEVFSTGKPPQNNLNIDVAKFAVLAFNLMF